MATYQVHANTNTLPCFIYHNTHTPRRRLALLLHLEPLFLPLPPSRASASCCELAPPLCSPAACEPSSKALRRGPYLCSRLVRTRGGGTVGGWTGATVPWCLCLGQHGRDAAIERHHPGVRFVRYAHARRHGCLAIDRDHRARAGAATRVALRRTFVALPAFGLF